MQGYILARVTQLFISLLVVLTFVFFLSRLAGDPVELMADIQATQAQRDLLRHELGLDQPLTTQYIKYMLEMVTGNFGPSTLSRRPVTEHIMERLPNTLELGFLAMLFSIAIGVPIGVYSAVKRGSWIDHIARAFAVLGQATPSFWLGIMLILLFGVKLRLLPPGGKEGIESLILPALTMGYFTAAAIMRMTRSAMLEVLTADYITFARVKGVAESAVIWKHALKNAVLPVITFSMMLFALFLGGAVVTETVFAWPGLGRLILEAVVNRDYPMIQGGVLVFSAIYLVSNLIVDIMYAYLNPKIRYSKSSS